MTSSRDWRVGMTATVTRRRLTPPVTRVTGFQQRDERHPRYLEPCELIASDRHGIEWTVRWDDGVEEPGIMVGWIEDYTTPERAALARVNARAAGWDFGEWPSGWGNTFWGWQHSYEGGSQSYSTPPPTEAQPEPVPAGLARSFGHDLPPCVECGLPLDLGYSSDQEQRQQSLCFSCLHWTRRLAAAATSIRTRDADGHIMLYSVGSGQGPAGRLPRLGRSPVRHHPDRRTRTVLHHRPLVRGSGPLPLRGAASRQRRMVPPVNVLAPISCRECGAPVKWGEPRTKVAGAVEQIDGCCPLGHEMTLTVTLRQRTLA